jgi:CheY-like chemotaxis protein
LCAGVGKRQYQGAMTEQLETAGATHEGAAVRQILVVFVAQCGTVFESQDQLASQRAPASAHAITLSRSRGSLRASVWLYFHTLGERCSRSFPAGGSMVERTRTHEALPGKAPQAPAAPVSSEPERAAVAPMLVEGVIHRINNPLASLLLGLAELSERLAKLSSEEQGTEAQRVVQEARLDGERVAAAVRELRALFPADAPRRIAPHAVLDEVATQLEQADAGRLRIQRRFGMLQPVFVREARFAQALRSAAELAIEALRRPGDGACLELFIEAEERPGQQLLLRLGALHPEQLGAESLSGASAARLSLLRGMLQQLGGALELTPSALSLSLPGSAPAYDSEAEVDLTRRASVPPRGEMRILLVDDDPSIHRALSRGLGELGLVQAVHSMASAIALLEGGATFDVILADLIMPGGTGLELFDWVKQQHPRLRRRMVLMTGMGETYADSHPDAVVVGKPFDLPALRELVYEVATRG